MGKNHDANNKPACMGISRFCEWSDDDAKYAALGLTVSGACSSHCTSYCNNFQNKAFLDNNEAQKPKPVTYPNGCFKCYGFYPGFYDPKKPYNVHPDYMDHYGTYKGPCTKTNP